MSVNRKQLGYLLIGLGLILAYWYSVHPLGFSRGYTEDWCHPEITRQLISESVAKFGGPRFFTESYGAPFGISLPYMSWGIEVSWLGSWFWNLNRDFPFLWAYFGFSLVISYLGVGYILRKMRLSPLAAWGLALVAVLFHVPRHYKIWHHYEHLLQHWVYWSLFLDAWIWQRFWRDRRWSWSLEFWRGLCLLGMMGTAGYFWGPLILEWLLLRACMASFTIAWRKKGQPVQVEGNLRQIVFPVLAGLALIVIDLRWFLPLAQEVKALGHVNQWMGWFAPITYMLRPLWLDPVVNTVSHTFGSSWRIKPVTHVETVVTVGWFLWIPTLIALRRLGKKRGGPGFSAVLPFFVLLVLGVLYVCLQPTFIQTFLQATIPFMKFFRVASRWGLFFPSVLVVLLALSWPELSRWAKEWTSSRPRKAWAWIGIFALLSVWEMDRMSVPVSTMPPLSQSAKTLLEGVKAAPGTAVLDMPFCLTGGNGMCGAQQCVNYPQATTGGCFRGWHDKSVYGVYASRLVEAQCSGYNRAPYVSWFSAWGEQRCLNEGEWKDFCGYLDLHNELAAILVYPDIWTGAGTPACQAQFEAHLGKPIAEASFVVAAVRGKEEPRFSRLQRYAAKCLKK